MVGLRIQLPPWELVTDHALEALAFEAGGGVLEDGGHGGGLETERALVVEKLA